MQGAPKAGMWEQRREFRPQRTVLTKLLEKRNKEKKEEAHIRLTRADLGLGQLGHCLAREGPNVGAIFYFILFFIYKYFWEILKHFSLHFFFSLLRKLKELSNVRDIDKTNLNK